MDIAFLYSCSTDMDDPYVQLAIPWAGVYKNGGDALSRGIITTCESP